MASNPVDPILYFHGGLPDHPEFDHIYDDSKPPEVGAMLRMARGPKRAQRAFELYKAGFVLDLEIDVFWWLDAWKEFAWRVHDGYTEYVPAYGMPTPSNEPGFPQPTVAPFGEKNYDWSLTFADAVKAYGPVIQIPRFYLDSRGVPQIDTSIFPVFKAKS